MALRVLTIDFKLDMTTAGYQQVAASVAGNIAQVPGLQRKTWTWNEETREAGGLYLFDNQASLDAYLGGPIVAALGAMKEVSDIRVRQFDVLEEASVITRGIGARQAESQAAG